MGILIKAMLRHLCIRFRRRRPITDVPAGKSSPIPQPDPKFANGSASIHPNDINGQSGGDGSSLSSVKKSKPFRVATFNASFFSMAPAVPSKSTSLDSGLEDGEPNSGCSKSDDQSNRLKGILKQSPLQGISSNTSEEDIPLSLSLAASTASRKQKLKKSKLRVSINLPDNEISRTLSFSEAERGSPGSFRGKGALRSSASSFDSTDDGGRRRRTAAEVLRELDADILALQDVKAEEERGMKPLSDLAAALGMNFVFAESWAPEYGNAVLSKWPITRSQAHTIFDDSDFRNVLKATIDVPHAGEVSFHCTHLDHLDENWRMKQINAIIQSTDEPHILAGSLNSLDQSDYSPERWTDIVKYYEDQGKPTPKVEVMEFLKGRHYADAKDFAGECEPVVMIAKGQSVQGTCKYGTRVDYILASPGSAYKFVPGSYSVLSSEGTSDHHIVKVDLRKLGVVSKEGVAVKKQHSMRKVVMKAADSASPVGISKTDKRERRLAS